MPNEKQLIRISPTIIKVISTKPTNNISDYPLLDAQISRSEQDHYNIKLKNSKKILTLSLLIRF